MFINLLTVTDLFIILVTKTKQLQDYFEQVTPIAKVDALTQHITELLFFVKDRLNQFNDVQEDQTLEEQEMASLKVFEKLEYVKRGVEIIFTCLTQYSALKDSPASSLQLQQTCPRVYEKLIQQLEADLRKHVKIESQQRLHMDFQDDHIEKLETDLQFRDQFIYEETKKMKKL